jgi:N utilization substance protein B
MKLCIAEWRGMEEIPVKVSMNEYLDLAKEYSTPKSSSFINGILDKIVTNLRDEGLLNKVGRGIIE